MFGGGDVMFLLKVGRRSSEIHGNIGRAIFTDRTLQAYMTRRRVAEAAREFAHITFFPLRT
jgi:hypothetical protein